MDNVTQLRPRQARPTTDGRFCCVCGDPAKQIISLSDGDTGEDCGFKYFCDAHGPNTPAGATKDGGDL